MILWAAILPALLAYGLYEVFSGGAPNDDGNPELLPEPDLPADLEPDLTDRAEARTVVGSGGDDSLDGTSDGDRIEGGSGDDLLLGGGGDDWLDGQEGTDTLEGGVGEDTLFGSGADILTGGEGGDVFNVRVGGEGPTIIRDLDFTRSDMDANPDRVNFLDENGNLIPKSAFFDGTYLVGIGDEPDGNSAAVYFGSERVAVIEGHSAEELFFQTIWIGNFQPSESGFYDGDDLIEGTGANEDFFGSYGNDTLLGGGGRDYLDGQDDNDFVDGTDDAGGEASSDTLVGGLGADTLRGDDGDLVSGSRGVDSFEIEVPERDGAMPVTIYGYSTALDPDGQEIITLVDSDGVPLPAANVLANLTIAVADDGESAALVYDGQVIVVLDNVDPEALTNPSAWIGNFPTAVAPPPPSDESDPGESGDEEPDPAPAPPVARDVITASVETAVGTGHVVTERFFGGNAIYSVNTQSGVPNPNFALAVDELDIAHLRFPAGQAEAIDGSPDGVGSLDVTRLESDEAGIPRLRSEVRAMLDYARDPNGDGNPNDRIMVTLVIPTKNLPLEGYRGFAEDIERFAEVAVRDYGDVIEAFEIGNEYWESIGETEYGQKASIAAVALENGMEAAGLREAEQPRILVQMASPYSGSDFHVSVDDRPFGQRVVDANQRLIDQLSAEAREAIDGVVEHYYYRRADLAFDGSSQQQDFINRDIAVWEDNFDKDLEVWITEWNVRTLDIAESGLRSASVLLEQAENMLAFGTDAAHAWPVQHNTDNDLAGRKEEMPVTDQNDRILSTINGAAFDLMSSSLVDLELIQIDLSVDDDRIEIQAYQSEDRTVVYISSRTLDPIDVNLDFTELVPNYDRVSGVKLGIDDRQNSADGVHFVPGRGYAPADFTVIEGQRYYYNENDVRARLTDLSLDSADVSAHLRPFEVIQITFETPGNTTPPEEELTSGEGGTTAGSERLIGTSSDDILRGGTGDDYVKGKTGDDSVNGGRGDDTLVGSQGDDTLRGGPGADVLNGQTGNDVLTGGDGADTITGFAGDDTFIIKRGHLAPGDVITDFQPLRDVIEVDLPGIRGLDDLSFVRTEDGVAVRFGRHGDLLLEGSFRIGQISDPRNFTFL